MKITKAAAIFGVTANAGNYSNERFEVQLHAELEEGQDPDEAVDALISRARKSIVHWLKESPHAQVRTYGLELNGELDERPF